MCGITGIIRQDASISLDKYYQAHLTIKHRGPDDEGFVIKTRAGKMVPCRGKDTISELQNLPDIRSQSSTKMVLGHRRLSILDRTYQGHQPFYFEGLWLIYNGEVYNYIEIRGELQNQGYRFETKTDTEVVIKAYHCWGTDAFSKFNGMWGMAIYEEANDRLILSRDRFGIKPLYYCLNNTEFLFASEVKFFKSLIQLMPNEKRMAEYLAICRIDHEKTTMLDPVCQLMPGHWLEFNPKSTNLIIHCYWRLPKTNQYLKNENEAIEQFQALFDSAIDLRMRSDVPVGSLLSGGLDSTSIVCNLFHRNKMPTDGFHTFSAVLDEQAYSERHLIEDTLAYRSELKSHFIKPNPEKFIEDFAHLLEIQEFPFRSMAVYSQFRLYQEIKNTGKATVLLNGQGADELFGGYTAHYMARIFGALQRGKVREILSETKGYKKYRNVSNKLIVKSLIWMLLSRVKKLLMGNLYIFHSNIFEDELRTNLLYSALPEYLHYEDRNSMAFSLETRLPFLDYRLVEWAFTLDASLKIRQGVTKWVQRKAVKNYTTPSVVASREKIGFVSPQEEWQKKELRIWMNDIIHSAEFSFLSKKEIMDKYNRYQTQNGDSWWLWRLVCLFSWLNTVNH